MPHDEIIPILDFGAQYAQLIARRVREKGVFSELVRPDIPASDLKKLNPKGIILSGGPSSVYEPNAPKCDPAIFDLGVPILGICYGMQLGCQILGGQVKPATAREFGGGVWAGETACRQGERFACARLAGRDDRLDESWGPGA